MTTIPAALLWARADVRRSWGSLLVVSLLIAATGGVVIAGIDGARRAQTSVERFIDTAGLADVTIYTDTPLRTDVLDRLRADPRIEQVATGRLLTVTPSAVVPGFGGGTMVMPANALGGARTPILAAGRYPVGPGEIAMGARSARDLGLSVGDRFAIHAVSFEDCSDDPGCDPVPAGTTRLTGILHTDQEFVPDPSGWVTLLATADPVADDIGREAAFGSISYAWTVPGVDVDEVVDEYAPLVDNGDIGSDVDDAGALGPAFRAVRYEHDAVLVASLVAALAGVLVVGQAHGRYLARRRSDVPALLAIGMNRTGRTISAWVPGVAAAIVGAALSVPVAIAASPVFPLRTARAADPDLGLHVDPFVLAVGVTLTCSLAVLAALGSAWRWSRRSVAATAGDVSAGARAAQLLQLRPMPTMGTRFALERSVGQQRLPTVSAMLATVAAVLMATAAVVIGTNVDRTLASPDTYGVTWDLTVGTGPDREAARHYVDADDRLASAYIIQAGELEVATDDARHTAPIVGIEAIKGPLELTMVEGRPPSAEGEVALTRTGTRETGARLGDRISLFGSTARDVEVVGVAVVPNEGLGARAEVVTTLALLDELEGQAGIADIDAGATVLLTASDPDDVASIRADLEAAGAAPEPPPRPPEVSLLDEIRFVPFVVAGFIVVLAVFSAFHALWTTSRRRRGELMLLCALGARPREVGHVPRWQALMLALFGVLVGVPLGTAVGRRIWTAIASERDLAPWIELSWLPITVIAAVTIGGVVLLAGIPARTVAGSRPAKELRAE